MLGVMTLYVKTIVSRLPKKEFKKVKKKKCSAMTRGGLSSLTNLANPFGSLGLSFLTGQVRMLNLLKEDWET